VQSPLHRRAPAGLHAGAPRTRLSPLASCVALVPDEMALSEGHLRELLASTVPAVEEIGHYLADAGGKRLRPLLTALGARAAGHKGSVARLMCAGELLHLGSLLHDDVVDGGLERRGRPAAQHVYGNPAVILTGDVCLARAVLLAGEEAGPTATLELARVVTAMSEGEVMQLQHAGRVDLGLDVYLDIIDRKSAALISWCAAAGAWAADRASESSEEATALQAYGRAVGVAFQITDDVLDYTGRADVTGKQMGRDLAERKLTLPLLLACERAPGLRDRLAERPPRDSELAELAALVVETGAPEAALNEARRRVGVGNAALEALPGSAHRDALVDLAGYLVDRVS
jgi:octaprenyl-diphosphate synthase